MCDTIRRLKVNEMMMASEQARIRPLKCIDGGGRLRVCEYLRLQLIQMIYTNTGLSATHARVIKMGTID